MGFRITTNMMMNSYRYNLQGNTKKLSDARDMVLTHRTFNSYAADPAGATMEFRLRRSLYQTNSQLTNTKNTYSKYNTAWNNLQGIKTDLLDKTVLPSSIQGDNGPTGEARRALATVLKETSESLIYALNQKLGDQFIFAGNDGLNVPFTWKGEDLYYRGINVKSGGLVEKPVAKDPEDLLNKAATGAGRQDPVDFGGNWSKTDEKWYQYLSGAKGAEVPEAGTRPEWVNELLKTDTANDTTKAWLNFYNDKDNYMKLKELGDEKLYMDLGMGLAENSPNNPVNGSYFNSALCGISFVGFGVDEDGDPKNLALLMREFADVFQAWDEDMDPQGYNPELAGETAKGLTSEQMEEKAYRLLDKLKASREYFTEKWDELDARAVFLKTNQERLETLMTDTNVQILDVSQVDLADAITSFSWQQYCYNAALKVGNQLLSQSLIDYMN
ncbi:hypothetical protein N510_002859 [Firmicutes bacterium ASF500]|nr:hypothetical protein N510_002859 [Firmicutes bacterium ASF500]